MIFSIIPFILFMFISSLTMYLCILILQECYILQTNTIVNVDTIILHHSAFLLLQVFRVSYRQWILKEICEAQSSSSEIIT